MGIRNYNIDVETKQCGQARPYQASFYHFIITDKSEPALHEVSIRNFCIGFLHKGYPKDKMPCWSSGEILTFKQVKERVWEYKVREEFTG